MAKFYVQSGKVRLVFDAAAPLDAAVLAFQWSCEKQATLQVDDPLEHVREAERRGWQLEEVIEVSELGFGRDDSCCFETFQVLLVWQQRPLQKKRKRADSVRQRRTAAPAEPLGPPQVVRCG